MYIIAHSGPPLIKKIKTELTDQLRFVGFSISSFFFLVILYNFNRKEGFANIKEAIGCLANK